MKQKVRPTLVISTLLLTSLTIQAQNQRSTAQTGGLTGYYIWKEDSLGFIKGNKIIKPFLQNFKIRFDNKSGIITSKKLSARNLRKAIVRFAHENNSSRKNKIRTDSNDLLRIPLKKIPSEHSSTVILTERNGQWSSRIRKNVLYFNVIKGNKIKFSHASDSLIISLRQTRLKTHGHYVVYRTFDKNGSIEKEKVYNYAGKKITDSIFERPDTIPKRYLIFANGYRGPKKNRDKTDNLVTTYDRYYYWYKLDDSIIQRLNPSKSYYIDGSMGVNTATHRSMVKFGISYAMASLFKNSKKAKSILNTKENKAGFETRKSEGRIAGRTFLRTRCLTPDCEFNKDTLDIVCHSMGYAYSIGFMEEVKDKVVFGKIYILAPESACVEGFDWQRFDEVWQYGTNDQAPVGEQDVIAPQCMVKGLDNVPSEKGGRIFVPKDLKFNKIHDIHDTKYFDWILNRISEGSPGYIH